MPRVRIHQHVNPLAPYYAQPVKPIEIGEIFADSALPLHLDIGSARGRFLLKMAKMEPDWNFLGVEIREPLVDEANRIGAEQGLTNLRYEFCNAMLLLDKLLETLPQGLLRMVTIQFPDPWFKKKHAKRRMVNKDLVETAAGKLETGGRIFVQTDIEFLAEEMFALFRAKDLLRETEITKNPFPVKTEREQAVEDKELPVYRRAFVRI
jgi:tRNA (guanine-N7-)-methyltransferase